MALALVVAAFIASLVCKMPAVALTIELTILLDCIDAVNVPAPELYVIATSPVGNVMFFHLPNAESYTAKLPFANEVNAMKRIWINKGLDGLLQRRTDEAALIRKCHLQ